MTRIHQVSWVISVSTWLELDSSFLAFLKFTCILQCEPSIWIPQTNSKYAFFILKFLVWSPQRKLKSSMLLGVNDQFNSNHILLPWPATNIYNLKCFISLSGYTRHKGVKCENNMHLRFSCYHPYECNGWGGLFIFTFLMIMM